MAMAGPVASHSLASPGEAVHRQRPGMSSPFLLVVTALLQVTLARGDFVFPTQSNLVFQRLDLVNVTYQTSFDSPALIVWCESPIIQKKIVTNIPARNGWALVTMDFSHSADQHCWFNLRTSLTVDEGFNSNHFTVNAQAREAPFIVGLTGSAPKDPVTTTSPTSATTPTPEKVQTTSPDTTPSPSGATKPSKSASGSPSSSPSPSSNGTSSQNSGGGDAGMSTAAAIGVGVGIGAGCTLVLSIIVGIFFALWLRRWKRRWLAKLAKTNGASRSNTFKNSNAAMSHAAGNQINRTDMSYAAGNHIGRTDLSHHHNYGSEYGGGGGKPMAVHDRKPAAVTAHVVTPYTYGAYPAELEYSPTQTGTLPSRI